VVALGASVGGHLVALLGTFDPSAGRENRSLEKTGYGLVDDVNGQS
jgi:hypothetical protein